MKLREKNSLGISTMFTQKDHATFNPFKGKITTLTKVAMRGAYLKKAEFREAARPAFADETG